MECQSCHTANPDANRFCENCGEPLTLKCASCGYACSGSARFCGGCGVPLARAPTAPAAGRGPPIVSAPASGWGELKQATVLFADVVSSTEQIAQLDPEEAMDRLKPAVMLMCESIERFGGTIMRTLGDGIFALFGAPKALEGHARLACEAALHMQSSFSRAPGGLRIRVGLHSGLVASDPYAHDTGIGGGAHGMTIHLASRVVGVASPGGITLTQDCHSLVRGSVDVESVGFPPLKGIPEPVEIFLLAGLKATFASQHFHQAKLTPFRGRDKEMAVLQQAQALAETGNAQVIGISGGPGAGKSRLCYEFGQWCRARGKPVFEVRAQPYGSATPLQPVLELMRIFFFGIAQGDTPTEARIKISARLDELGTDQPGDYALLCEFLGVTDGEGGSAPPSHAKTRRARLLAIVSALVKQSADTAALILIEDMHWLDDASEEFVAALVQAVVATKTMVVLNYRSSYRSPWTGFENFQEVEVGELSAGDTDAIVRELISHRREFQQISQLIVKRSGGNPFFAEELVRSLAERGVLSGDPNHPSNGIDSVQRALPATVQAVIGARIDRLSEAEKSLLQMCAIIGKEVPLLVLERVAGTMRGQIERALDALCHAELIQPQPAVGGRRFSFRHPLIQEVAYESQLKAKRAAIHASVANAMEHYYTDQLDEYAALISHHYEAAGDALSAAEYSARAAHWLGGTDSGQASKHWRKVRTLLAEQSGNPQADRLRAMACSQIALLGWREGLSLQEVQPFIEEAMGLAGEIDGRLTQLLLMIEGRMIQASGGPVDWYVERVQQALAMAEASADAGRIAMVKAVLSQAYGWSGLLGEALRCNDAALADVHAIDPADREFIGFSIEQWLLALRSRLLARLGRFDDAHECLGQLMALGETASDPVVRLIFHHCHVDLARFSEDPALAQEHAAKISELDQKHAIPYLQAATLNSRGMARSISGQHEAAITEFTQALKLVRTANVAAEHETEILANLAESQRRIGDLERALLTAREGVEMARQRSARVAECRALITLGAALLDVHGGARSAEAGARFAEAAALIEVTGARIYESALSYEQARLRQMTLGSMSPAPTFLQ
ncbi:MAG TPA: adenylate/guanylate cyclase domain-containing protein [Ramlibacter sp.]|nr:adenylate/guanylate cyclase domain-containing protein [Ramlibacter sp.]